MKNVLIISNPRAGKNSGRINTGEIVRAFRAKGIECLEKTTTGPWDAAEIAQKYASSHDAVVCCGGDGTYNEVINGMMLSGADVPVIYLPCGSTNDFAHTLGITKDTEAAVQMYVDNMINRFDIGKFNDKYFSYVASFGLATEISYSTSQRLKNLLGHSAYLINGFVFRLIPMLSHLKPAHMKIEYDGGVLEDDFFFGAIGNTNEISGLFKLDKSNIKMNDGLFEVLLVKNASVKTAGGIFVNMIRQDYSGDKIVFFKTDKLKITASEEVPWTLDGEYGGAHTDTDISICKRAIKLVSPKSRFLDETDEIADVEN